MTRTRIVNCDPESVSTLHWGTAEKWIASAVIGLLGIMGSILFAVGAAAVAVGWQTYNLAHEVAAHQAVQDQGAAMRDQHLIEIIGTVKDTNEVLRKHLEWSDLKSRELDELTRKSKAK